ncbi:hypothetical protein GCM10025734_05970 [Kitasatospora paranensis]
MTVPNGGPAVNGAVEPSELASCTRTGDAPPDSPSAIRRRALPRVRRQAPRHPRILLRLRGQSVPVVSARLHRKRW